MIIAALFHRLFYFDDCLFLCNLLARCHERFGACADRACRLQIVHTRNIGKARMLVFMLRRIHSCSGVLLVLRLRCCWLNRL